MEGGGERCQKKSQFQVASYMSLGFLRQLCDGATRRLDYPFQTDTNRVSFPRKTPSRKEIKKKPPPSLPSE